MEQYNALLARVERLEAAADIMWGAPFTPAPTAAPQPTVFLDMLVDPSITLLPSVEMSPGVFHARWEVLPIAGVFTLHAQRLPTTPVEVEAWCRDVQLFTFVSGDTGDTMKWFLAGQDTMSSLHLLEVILDKATKTIVVIVKSTIVANAPVAAGAFKAALRNLPAVFLGVFTQPPPMPPAVVA